MRASEAPDPPMAKYISRARTVDGTPAFIVYYDQRRDDTKLVGILISRSHAWLAEGTSAIGPEKMWTRGERKPFPLEENADGEFFEIAAMIAQRHPELMDLLHGRITFQQALRASGI